LTIGILKGIAMTASRELCFVGRRAPSGKTGRLPEAGKKKNRERWKKKPAEKIDITRGYRVREP